MTTKRIIDDLYEGGMKHLCWEFFRDWEVAFMKTDATEFEAAKDVAEKHMRANLSILRSARKQAMKLCQ